MTENNQKIIKRSSDRCSIIHGETQAPIKTAYYSSLVVLGHSSPSQTLFFFKLRHGLTVTLLDPDIVTIKVWIDFKTASREQ